ncbi:MAG TPA: DUF2461 domain-containing protein [Vicinamibacterales bacterium]|nr:DUF2461 domain-containing protein [Vicinamibacterales bacterium]
MTAPRFSKDTLAFLTRLKRNNRREWFNARKDEYERVVRQPMFAIIDRLAVDMRRIAPELLVGPKCVYRIYRDVRFSENKQPYKTHVAASFWHRALGKGGGAGLYFHIAPDGVWIGGGMYHPEMPQLHKVRLHLAGNFDQFRSIVESPGFKRALDGGLEGERMTRVPRGFPKDHEAAEYLKYRQFIAGREFPAAFATQPKFYPGVLDVFRRTAPLVRFLNEALQ